MYRGYLPPSILAIKPKNLTRMISATSPATLLASVHSVHLPQATSRAAVPAPCISRTHEPAAVPPHYTLATQAALIPALHGGHNYVSVVFTPVFAGGS